MAKINEGDASPITVAHQSQRAVAPLDGQIWRITGGDYANKEVFDSVDDIDGSSGVTLIFGKGTYGAFSCNNCVIWGQGSLHTVFSGAKQVTIGEKIFSYAFLATGTCFGGCFKARNDGSDDGLADMAMGLGIGGFCLFEDVAADASSAVGVHNVADIIAGNGSISILNKCVGVSQHPKFGIYDDGSAVCTLNACTLLGDSSIALGGGGLLHNMTCSFSKVHVGKGMFMATDGIYHIILGGGVHSVTDYFDGLWD